MIKTNRELHALVECFVNAYNSSDDDIFKHPDWYNLVVGIYESKLPFSTSQFATLLVNGGLSRASARIASIGYSNACELLKNYEDRINAPAY